MKEVKLNEVNKDELMDKFNDNRGSWYIDIDAKEIWLYDRDDNMVLQCEYKPENITFDLNNLSYCVSEMFDNGKPVKLIF